MDVGNGNVLPFFEIPNTPSWVRHIAFKVDSVRTLHDTERAPKEAAWMHERELAGTTATG